MNVYSRFRLIDFNLFAGTSVSTACSKYICSGRYSKISLMPHYVCSCWSALASCSTQNKFQDCFYRFQGISFSTAILSRRLCPRYVPTRSLRSFSSLSICIPSRKTEMARSKSFSSVASDIWNKLPCHLSYISALPVFRKRLKHHLFSSAFPGISSPSTDIPLCDVITSTNVNHIKSTLPPS